MRTFVWLNIFVFIIEVTNVFHLKQKCFKSDSHYFPHWNAFDNLLLVLNYTSNGKKFEMTLLPLLA